MTHPAYIKEKALQLRREKHLSIVEIAERLALPKTTIYYWLKDEPLGRARKVVTPEGAGGTTNAEKARALRQAAYGEGRQMFPELVTDPAFRDFVCLFIAEGYKRNRNTVSLCNSDPRVVVLADRWIRGFTQRPVSYTLQYHADQDLAELCLFWEKTLNLPPYSIRVQRKSNSNQLAGRSWRSRYGVLTVRTFDTYFRARLQAWMDLIRAEWLDASRPRAA